MNDNQRIYTGKTETKDKFQLNLIEKKKPFSWIEKGFFGIVKPTYKRCCI